MLSVYTTIPTRMKHLCRVSLLLLIASFLHLFPTTLLAYHSNLDTLYISLPDQEGQTGDTITLNLRVRNFTDIVGVQFDFRFDTAAMSFIDLSIGDLEVIGFGSFGLGGAAEGSIRFSWADFTDQSHTLTDNSILFSLTMKVKQPLSSLQGRVSLSEQFLRAEYISNSLEQGVVSLLIDELSDIDDLRPLISSLHIFPNPCLGAATMNFHLETGAPATILIYNEIGQVISEQRLYLSAGEHQLPLQFPHAGRFWYGIRTPLGSHSAPIMVME